MSERMTDESLALRQVHPSFCDGGTISTQVFSTRVFRPNSQDEGLLSVYNGEYFSPEESFGHYTEEAQLKSAGVVAVTKKECATVDLQILEDNSPFEGHCSIDYRGLSNGDVKRKSEKLRDLAKNRGWLFQNATQIG